MKADFAGRAASWLQPTRQLSDAQTVLENRLAFLVGCCAIALPLILWLAARLPQVCMRDSISHFFYHPFLGTFFVGILFFIGCFMLALTGENGIEKYGSSAAGIGAVVLATYPTSGDGCELAGSFAGRPFSQLSRLAPPFEPEGTTHSITPPDGGSFFAVFPGAENWHMYGAGAVFVFLGIYCLFVMTRVVKGRHRRNGALRASKRNRNRLYRICGSVILACVAVLALKGPILGETGMVTWNWYNLTFYVEALALLAFAVAWFAKGRLFPALNDTTPRRFSEL